MSETELSIARTMALADIKQNKCGIHCIECGSFYTMTGYGKPWHNPGCSADKSGGRGR